MATDQSKIGVNNMTQIKDLKMLFVDDDVMSLDLLVRITRKHVREIITANSGLQAIEICKKRPDIDVVLMDIKMPGIDGFESSLLIREFNKDVVIIAQSAYAVMGDRQKAFDAGCNDYLSKPIVKNELLAMLVKYLV